MVYGPIAAWLVELFPTRIRYSGLSLPYHIGNGWFGGFLPATVFAIVAATGNIYSGLWYPIVIAAMSFVVGLIFLPETKDRDITTDVDETAGRPSAGRPTPQTRRPAPSVRGVFVGRTPSAAPTGLWRRGDADSSLRSSRVSSAVEQRFCKPLVGSSILSPGTRKPLKWPASLLRRSGAFQG